MFIGMKHVNKSHPEAEGFIVAVEADERTPTKAEIEAVYHNKSMSVVEVAKNLDISMHKLYSLINEYEIDRRHPVSQRASGNEQRKKRWKKS